MTAPPVPPDCAAVPRLWDVPTVAAGRFGTPADFDTTDSPCIPPPTPNGNFRVRSGDRLCITLLGGAGINQKDVKLEAQDALGTKVIVPKKEEATLGSIVWEWEASTGGPVQLQFSSIAFDEKSKTAAEQEGVVVEEKGGRFLLTGYRNTVIVDPVVKVREKVIPYGAIAMQTVLSRSLGPVDGWLDSLSTTAELGYNLVHFTPVQRAGESGSCYSLADHTRLAKEVCPSGGKADAAAEFTALKNTVEEVESKLGIVCTTDLVLNHAASNSSWLNDHPECGYNLDNSPWLRGAKDLDVELQNFSKRLVEGAFVERYGASKEITGEEALRRLIRALREECVKPFRMHEWFRLDVDACLEAFRKAPTAPCTGNIEDLKRAAVENVGTERLRVVIRGEASKAVAKDESHLRDALRDVQNHLDHLAGEAEKNVVNAVEGFARWERLQCQKGPVGSAHWDALAPRYFTPVTNSDGKEHYLANNGWVMDWDATKDFAAAGTLVYLRRDLVVWADCVKLRYGSGPSDCPFLWDWITNYCVESAKIFKGVRLDNCHSTPLHVAKHILKACRAVRPDLWVYAELFTGSQSVDWLFERELGLNAMIREAMQTSSPADLSYHVGRYGGQPLGCLDKTPSVKHLDEKKNVDGFVVSGLLTPSLATPLLYDCTHDNETPAQKRTAADALPTAALVAAAGCCVGSSRGFDELIPRTISVVNERRCFKSGFSKYVVKEKGKENETDQPIEFLWPHDSHASLVVVKGGWDGWKADIALKKRGDGKWEGKLDGFSSKDVFQYKFIVDGRWLIDDQQPVAQDEHGNKNNKTGSLSSRVPSDWIGLMGAKRRLNLLHRQLAEEGFTEMSTEMASDTVTHAVRYNPKTFEMCHFIVRSRWDDGESGHVSQLEAWGKATEEVMAARLHVGPQNFVDDSKVINGLDGRLWLAEDSLGDAASLHYDEHRDMTIVKIHNFPPGSVVVFKSKVNSSEGASKAVEELENTLKEMKIEVTDAVAANYLLYSSENEERDRSNGSRGCYDVPAYGCLKFGGFASAVPLLDSLRRSKNMASHPLARNFREGDWFITHQVNRLEGREDLKDLKKQLEKALGPITKVPRPLAPHFADRFVSAVYAAVASNFLNTTPVSVKYGDDFVRSLGLATLQCYGSVPSAPLTSGTSHPSLAAGLPHFSTGFMRNWGRDTFIALRGTLIVPGRYEEARDEILGFARVMRHGLIPNLLDGGNNPRFNARDATWFFMQAVQDYCLASVEGLDFLQQHVELKYPLPTGASVKNIGDLMHFILETHARGFEFEEWNAGKKIDEHMKPEGFHVAVCFHKDTGIITGGNRHNCGTWMDKMGSSEKAGNKGVPATPRDGAAIEIIGLLKSTLRFVSSLPPKHFPHDGVTLADGQTLKYKEWNSLLMASFEKLFYVPAFGEEAGFQVDVQLAHRRCIYKDTFHASAPWCDYQLRPNAVIAMAVAPELFNETHARAALKVIEEILWAGPKAMGLRTLDPGDINYRGDYDNADDSEDRHVAHGWNYHQGPEWLWPLGYLLEAKLLFSEEKTPSDALVFDCLHYLQQHRRHVIADPWMSLPELTNSSGKFCPHSCASQAWSIGTLLGFFRTLEAKTTTAVASSPPPTTLKTPVVETKKPEAVASPNTRTNSTTNSTTSSQEEKKTTQTAVTKPDEVKVAPAATKTTDAKPKTTAAPASTSTPPSTTSVEKGTSGGRGRGGKK